MTLNLPVHPRLRHPLTGQPLQAVYVDKHGWPRWPVIGASEGAPEGGGGGTGSGGTGSGAGGSGGQGQGGQGGQGGSGGGSGGSGSGSGSGTGSGSSTGGSGSGAGSGDGSGTGSATDDDGKDLGYPKDTPVDDMNDKQRAAYWRHQAQSHEKRNKGWSRIVNGKTAEQLKADQDELEELRKGKRSDAENAVEEAKKATRREVEGEFTPKLVKVALQARLSHMKDEDRDDLIDTLDLTKFVDEHGEPDNDKLRKFAERHTPAGTATRRVDYGGGRRESAQGSRADAGRAEAERRFGKPGAAASGS